MAGGTVFEHVPCPECGVCICEFYYRPTSGFFTTLCPNGHRVGVRITHRFVIAEDEEDPNYYTDFADEEDK